MRDIRYFLSDDGISCGDRGDEIDCGGGGDELSVKSSITITSMSIMEVLELITIFVTGAELT